MITSAPQARPEPGGIAFIPSMARLAIALDKSREFAGLGRAYRLYLAGQADSVAHNGRGWCYLSALFDLFTSQHRRTILRAIPAGIGIFYHIRTDPTGRDRLQLISQARAAARLMAAAARLGIWDHDELSPRKAIMTQDDLTGEYSQFCAAAFRGWIASAKGGKKRITYKVLSDAWRRSGPIIAEWIRLAGLERRHNHGEIPCNDRDRSAAYPGFDREDTRNGYYKADWRGNWAWRFGRGNTYLADWSFRWKHGRIRKVARALAGESGDRGGLNKSAPITPAECFGGEAGHSVRLKLNFEPPGGPRPINRADASPSRNRRAKRIKRAYRAWRDAHGWHPDHDHYIMTDIYSRGRDLQQVWLCAPAFQPEFVQ